MLPVDRLRPNKWNPNSMTEEQETELLEEVRRLGRPSKTIVVRHVDDDYEIVDGEHNWNAAKKGGLVEVACEVVEVDECEAMRLTYVRNLHGTRNPVRTAECSVACWNCATRRRILLGIRSDGSHAKTTSTRAR